MAARREYTRELLEGAVAQSSSVMDLLRHLGLNQAGGTHAHVSRMIRRSGIDTSHFVRHRNGAHLARLRPEQLLVRTAPGSSRTKNCHSQTANFAGRSRNKYAHVLPDGLGADRGRS